MRAARHGAFAGVPKGDVAQRPGTFVVSPEGVVLYAHYHQDSSDNPQVEELLDVVRSYAPTRVAQEQEALLLEQAQEPQRGSAARSGGPSRIDGSGPPADQQRRDRQEELVHEPGLEHRREQRRAALEQQRAHAVALPQALEPRDEVERALVRPRHALDRDRRAGLGRRSPPLPASTTMRDCGSAKSGASTGSSSERDAVTASGCSARPGRRGAAALLVLHERPVALQRDRRGAGHDRVDLLAQRVEEDRGLRRSRCSFVRPPSVARPSTVMTMFATTYGRPSASARSASPTSA